MHMYMHSMYMYSNFTDLNQWDAVVGRRSGVLRFILPEVERGGRDCCMLQINNAVSCTGMQLHYISRLATGFTALTIPVAKTEKQAFWVMV